MYLNSQNIVTAIVVTIIVYLIFLFSIYLLLFLNNRNFLLLKKFNHTVKFVFKFNLQLIFQEMVLGILMAIVYVLVLQFKFYFYFQYAPIIIYFLLMHVSRALSRTSLIFHWIGFSIVAYLLFPTTIFYYYVILVSSLVGIIGVYLLRLIVKQDNYLVLWKSILFLVVIQIIYASFFRLFNEKFSFDFFVNLWISFLSLIFLSVINNYAASLFKSVNYLKRSDTYVHGFFINNNQSLDALKDFIVKKEVNLGLYLTFDVISNKKHNNAFYIEKHSRTLLKIMLAKFEHLFLISPNLAFSVFLKVKQTSNKQITIRQIDQIINNYIKLINRLLFSNHLEFKMIAYGSYLGNDFYDFHNLVQTCELGIYNSDFLESKYLRFNKETLIQDLMVAKQKKALIVFLKKRKITVELDLNSNKYYTVRLIDLQNMLFDFDSVFSEIPNNLREIFLRLYSYEGLKKFKPLIFYQRLLYLRYPLSFLIANQFQIKKIVAKIKALQIPLNLVVFELYDENADSLSNFVVQKQKIFTIQHCLKQNGIHSVLFN